MNPFSQLLELSKIIAPARVVKVQLCTAHQWLTLAGDCGCDRSQVAFREKYAIAGTAYGFLHNSAGDIRFWNSRSGAAHHLKKHFH